MRLILILAGLPPMAFAGERYFVYRPSMTQLAFDSLKVYGDTNTTDATSKTAMLPAANTNYYILEVTTQAASEDSNIKTNISNGSMIHVGSRYMESYFDSRTGQQVLITKTSTDKVIPKELTTPFYVEKSTP